MLKEIPISMLLFVFAAGCIRVAQSIEHRLYRHVFLPPMFRRKFVLTSENMEMTFSSIVYNCVINKYFPSDKHRVDD